MDRIEKGKITMRPRIYFVLGSVLVFVGLVATVIVSVFLISLMRFVLRAHGPMGQYRYEALLASFPWWALILTCLGLVAGIKLLRHYDFSYKKNFLVIVIGFIAVVFAAGWFIDATGLDAIWLQKGPMRGIMRRYIDNETKKIPKGGRIR